MSAVVKRALPLLHTLAEAKPKFKKAIIKNASPELLKAISEIVLNMLKGIIPLSPQQKQRLSRYKNVFRALAKKGLSAVKKRKLLVQKGGGAGLAVKNASPELLKAISEIVLNMLKGIIPLSPQQKQRLSRYKNVFRALAKKGLSAVKKRKLLVQKGGGAGLAVLLPIALSLLAQR